MKITDLGNDYTVVGNISSPVASPVATKKEPFVNKVANFFGAKGITEQFGADIARAKAPEAEKRFVEYPKMKEVLGSAAQFGANFLPGAGIGAKLGTKVAVGAGTGYAFDVGSKLQQDKLVSESLKPGIGTTAGAGIPIAGAILRPAVRIVGRMVKGLGSGLSGVSTETIDKILSNPHMARKATEMINKKGGSKVLEENAKKIMGGVGMIKREARKAFGEGVESLAKTDIKPVTFRARTQSLLDKYGVQTTAKGKRIANFDFTDEKNVTKAHELIKKLHNAELDGKSLRKLADDIDTAGYKIATSDERLSFNAFVKDLSATLKGAIADSTSKLGKINKKFSADMQLAEAVEDIFGKVKYRNLKEVVRATKRLETLFAQKGIAPDVIDDFLNRIGLSPDDFKTTEAVRQISNKSMRANEPGLSLGEFVRSATSAVITPEMVRKLSVATGLAEEVILPELKKLPLPLSRVFLNLLVQNRE